MASHIQDHHTRALPPASQTMPVVLKIMVRGEPIARGQSEESNQLLIEPRQNLPGAGPFIDGALVMQSLQKADRIGQLGGGIEQRRKTDQAVAASEFKHVRALMGQDAWAIPSKEPTDAIDQAPRTGYPSPLGRRTTFANGQRGDQAVGETPAGYPLQGTPDWAFLRSVRHVLEGEHARL